MSTIELQTLTGLEIDSRSARGRCGKNLKWLSGCFAAGPHLSIRLSHVFPGGRVGAAHGVSIDAARPPDPVAFAMDFLRKRDDSLPKSNGT
ncbi:hypothetical protein [Mesorhizobium loti]|uniref:hypothetical protein n=1 Tax=Rhizobium loti TaxID=381 RepID=UPI0012678DA4|nr:hypothetical protein [Mesorhizobium loti]